ncbi:uracil-DNA glycosylase family protein [Gelria sp. Kuro-4]|uniref:uracil-DNA glycosylase n=1 Tax=Gelria sp. Kuro-4 TaxID=2796927 RepID=UPI001BEE5010|nr:uracil-DNA glycosylase [Gelria sp. Kuro-4]MDI3522584.1 uracil-DNA glycosylase [Bacillota bacterium]MDK2927773.1 uracil-DNA glycosylase [Bacillota bacterium]BCV25538.1 uracil-DNA glycosylase [Gelria sp. Kuro-4]
MEKEELVQLSLLGEPEPPAPPSPPRPPWETAGTLEELERLVGACRRCRLRAGCRRVVFGEGNPQAALMLVGEGPGQAEDEQGRPFVGAAGQLLNNILAAAGIERSEVFIGNVVKCRPPGNRLPLPDEVKACRPYLEAQLRLIRPRIVVCLGALAAQTLIDPAVRITRERGRWVEKDGLLIMPTFHPAALLRDPSKKRPVWQDFQAVLERYRGKEVTPDKTPGL